MFVKRLLVCLLNLLFYIIQESNGWTRYCETREPVVNFCANSEVKMTTNVFIDTDNVPTLQENTCVCTISPVYSNIHFLLTYRKAPPRNENFHMQFKLNDIVLNKTTFRANTTLHEKTEMVLETSADFNTEGVCLILSTADATKFNISCKKPISASIIWSEESTTYSTMSTFDGYTNTTADDGNNVDISIIGPAVGGAVGGAVVLVLVIVVIFCCRRKVLRKNHKRAAETSRQGNEAPKTEDDDYYMTENPMYIQSDIPKYSPLSQNEDHMTEENNDRPLHNESPVDVQLIQTEQDQNDNHSTAGSNNQE